MSVHHGHALSWAKVVTVAPEAIAVLPIGSQEQHAGHLPLGTDTILVEAALNRALTQFENDDQVELVVLPTLPYGHSPHHLFRAAVSVTAATLLQMIGEFLDSLHACGFRRMLIVNGHGGNTEILSLAVKQFALRANVVAATCNYWDLSDGSEDDERGLGAEDASTTPGHAGRFETSLMLAAHPEFVGARADVAVPSEPPLFDRVVHRGLTIAPSGEWERVGGLTDDPGNASREIGVELLERRAAGLADAIRAFDKVTVQWKERKY